MASGPFRPMDIRATDGPGRRLIECPDPSVPCVLGRLCRPFFSRSPFPRVGADWPRGDRLNSDILGSGRGGFRYPPAKNAVHDLCRYAPLAAALAVAAGAAGLSGSDAA